MVTNLPKEVDEEDFNDVLYISPPIPRSNRVRWDRGQQIWVPREISMQTAGVDHPMRGGYKRHKQG